MDNQEHSLCSQHTSVYIPTATYRVQFNAEFPFKAAEHYASYFQRLGVSDIYSSPIWKAASGSMHGYDVVDHTLVNPELGGEEDFKSLSSELAARSLGIVVDLVPNHMGITDSGNRLWWDVLENGSSSPYARFFDIDWRANKEELHDRVELPILGEQFGICLENGELKVGFSNEGAFRVHYYDTVLPSGPRTWIKILGMVLKKLSSRMPADSENLIEFQSILTALRHLPMRDDTDPDQIRERQREKEVCKRRLRVLVESEPLLREAINEMLVELNGNVKNSQTFDTLEEFLESQVYRLSYWRVAGDEINYRRFFDVNSLAAIRVEIGDVFDHVHELIFRLIREGNIRGLRVDHPDGLLNPPQYFSDLQKGCLKALSEGGVNTAADEKACAMWVVAEKILEHQERIRADWAVHGTTGYDFLNVLNGVFIDRTNAPAFFKLYGRFTGAIPNYDKLKHQCKKLILDITMSGELYTLASKLDRISEHNRRTRDFTLPTLQEALAEYIAAFPFYRTYIRPEAQTVDEDDRLAIESAIRRAKRNNPSSDPTIYDFIGAILLMKEMELATEEQKQERQDFVLKLQQVTGPVMAKGLEDTAFYREYPLVSLNEVGGEPARFGVSVAEFHQRCEEQARLWPATLNATSTHDTKRSEDARARLNVLSEIPRQWESAVVRWRRMNSKAKTELEGVKAPDPREEYLFYQALLAIWPFHEEQLPDDLADRMSAYMIKATREAKVNTSWMNVNGPQEEALTRFVREVLDPTKSPKFQADFKTFARLTTIRGANNSLSQTLAKLTAPGVPDFYQGSELWDTSLVDPDNRRHVDYDLRVRILDEIIHNQHDPHYLSEVLHSWRDGRIKMLVTHKGLAFRRAYEQLYQDGTYVALEVEGEASESVLAYAQHRDGRWAITIVPRLLAKRNFPEESLIDEMFWGDTSLRLPDNAPQKWHNIFTGLNIEAHGGDTIAVRQHLGSFPVGLLVSQ